MKTRQYFNLAFYRYKMVAFSILLLVCGAMKAENRQHPVSVTIFNQSWAWPFSELNRFSPLYPGLTVGIYRLQNERMFTFPQSVHMGYFYNNACGSALFLHGDQSIRFNLKCGFFIEPSLGLGYFHAFHAHDIYKRNSDGRYGKAVDFGKPSVMFSLSQTIGFDLSKKYGIPIAPFVKIQGIISYPYWEIVLPIRPSNLVHIGTLIYF